MIKSVIVIPSTNNNKKASSVSGDDKSRSQSSSSRQQRSHDRGDGRVGERSERHRRDGISNEVEFSPHSHGHSTTDSRRKEDRSVKEPTSFMVTSIDCLTKLNWPSNSVKYTSAKPSLSYSCEPSFSSHNINLSREQENHRKDLFVISDLLDDIIDCVDFNDVKRRKHGHKRKSSSKKSKKKKKAKAEVTNSVPADHSKKKKKKGVKERKHLISEGPSSENAPPKDVPLADTAINPTTSMDPEANTKEIPCFSSIANGENVKVEKKVKKLKHLKKKMMSATAENPSGPLPAKKPKITTVQPDDKGDETNQQKIKIAFNQNSGKLSTKSKWDTSSDEEGTSRKGAISYRFSDESDNQPSTESTKTAIDPVAAKQRKLKQTPFGKMQPGGILKTIEIHNPLPDMKPAVPIAHPNPGPDGAPARSPSRSRTRSRSRSRSHSRSYSYSSDGSYHRSRRRRRHGRRRRSSYSRSYSRSRSGSYSTSRSRSRSYSRSYSRSTSRSRSRYRSYSRSSYSSYSSRSYSSRSRSRSPRYTRAVQPKYNNTRAYNLGKRKKFNKKKNQFKNQQNQQLHQNPNIQKQLETGRMKAEETVMRLKKQKEEQEDLQKRAMESIAKAASSAGIPLPTTSTASGTPASNASTSSLPATGGNGATAAGENSTPMPQPLNGVSKDLVDSYEEASQMASAPAFVPRTFQNREFIGPVRPGMESDIPLPAGTPTNINCKEIVMPQQLEPLPMPAPNPDDNMYKDLEAQAIQHVQASNSSPTTEHLQQMGVAQYAPQLQDAITTFIDPMTGQQVQLTAHPQLVHHQQQQQQMFLPMPIPQQAQSPQSPDGDQQFTKDGKPAPHEAVIKSYAHQVFMSQQKALVSQSQATFTVASSSTSVPQAGLPIQTTPVIVTPAQIQMAQLQQAQAVQAAQVQAAHAQAIQMQQLQQIQAAAAVGLTPQAVALQPGLQQLLAQQQLMQAQAAQSMAPQQLMQLPNGQVVVANPAPHAMVLQRFQRPM